MRRALQVISVFLLLHNVVQGQEVRKAKAIFTEESLKIDGVLDEDSWQRAVPLHEFYQNFPTDTLMAQYPTQIKILFNNTFLYIGIVAESKDKDFVVASLKRDFRGSSTDNVSFFFDTFQDGVNAYQFGVNPYGAQRESLVSDGGISRQSFNPDWDVKWYSEGHIEGNRYVAEMAIPFVSVKYPEGCTQWNFQAYRFDIQSNERSTWSRVDQNQLLSHLGYLGVLEFDRPLSKNNTANYLIPYSTLSRAQDFENDQPRTSDLKFGADVKIPIGNKMNLDLTINPDFSNVEADNLINNITRFEISLPEKRQFFLDNSDLFSSFGNARDAAPFFSRRIGIAQDLDGNTIQNNIIGGARLSGKISNSLRLGVLSIQTQQDQANEIPSNNNSMVTLQKKIFSRSQIGVFLINREATNKEGFLDPEQAFNRVLGLDYNLVSKDNTWSGKFFAHKSFNPNDSEGNISSQALMRFNTRFWNAFSMLLFVDQEFGSDIGFIPRKGFIKKADKLTRIFYPKTGSINTHRIGVYNEFYYAQDLDFRQTDHTLKLEYLLDFKDQNRLEFNYFNRYVYLFDDFDPTRSDSDTPLPMGSDYRFNTYRIIYQSNFANAINWEGGLNFGEFYNGRRTGLSGVLNYRVQPKFNLSLSVDYNRIRLPDPYPSRNLILIAPKLEWTFTKNVFWSNFIQYSNQQDNLGINSRLQWRFAPMSDLFIVYNDGYDTTTFYRRYQSINLKLSYWFSI